MGLACLNFLSSDQNIHKNYVFFTVVCAVNALAHHVLSKDLEDIVGDFRGFYRQLMSEGQLRWVRGRFCKMLP